MTRGEDMLIRHKRKLVAISASIALTTVLTLETMSAHALPGASVTYTKDQKDLPVVSSVVTDVTSGSRYSANPGENAWSARIRPT